MKRVLPKSLFQFITPQVPANYNSVLIERIGNMRETCSFRLLNNILDILQMLNRFLLHIVRLEVQTAVFWDGINKIQSLTSASSDDFINRRLQIRLVIYEIRKASIQGETTWLIFD